MNIWIVVNGEKLGPFADYEVRKKIDSGEVGPDVIAWHEGMAEWTPLSRISLFEREFASREVDPREQKPSVFDRMPGKVAEEGSVPGDSFWLRRFWARWLDLHLFAGLVWLGLYFSNANVGAIFLNPWLMLLLYLPWVPVEAYLLARYQTTPGKWLLGLRVVRADGTSMDGRASTRRAVRVYFLGMGMGWGVIALICQSIAFFFVRANGRALWDMEGNTVVEGKPWKTWWLPTYIITYILVVQMQLIVVTPYMIEITLKRYPEWREWIEKSPPKHLPKRQ